MRDKSFMRIFRISLKNWHRMKKHNVVWALMLREHSKFKLSSKIMLKFVLAQETEPQTGK